MCVITSTTMTFVLMGYFREKGGGQRRGVVGVERFMGERKN